MSEETDKAEKRTRDGKPKLKPLPVLVVYAFTYDPATGRGNMVGNIADDQALELLQKLVFTKLRTMKIAEADGTEGKGGPQENES